MPAILECQDMYHFSGIERDVFLYATEKLNIRELKLSALLKVPIRMDCLVLIPKLTVLKGKTDYTARKAA